MSKILAALCVLACMSVIALGVGAEPNELYEAEVPVSGRDPQLHPDAVLQALLAVAVKVSGQSQVASQLKSAVANPERLVQQFTYREGEGGRTMLWVRFEPRAVDDLLRAHGLPVWGNPRPTVLLWLGLEDQGQRILVGADERPDLQQAATAAARRRGIPLFMPLLDLEDQTRVQAADVWAGRMESLRSASARYHADAILVAHVAPVAADHWVGEWTLQIGGEPKQWRTEGSATGVVEAGVDDAADALARHPAGAGGGGPEQQALMIKVKGIGSLPEYARVLRYLASLSPVKQVRPRLVEPDSVTFSLDVSGGRADLDRAIALGHLLAPVPSPAGAAAEYGLTH
jgi:hypothetical protein